MGVKAEVEKTPQNAVGKGFEGFGTKEKGEEDTDMGGTEGLEKGKGKIGDPQWVEVTVDIPGQRDDDPLVVFLGAMIHEALVADGTLGRRLRLGERWHWKLYVDVCPHPILLYIFTQDTG